HPKLTGGGGFQFEEKVVAAFLASMLASRPVLGAEAGTLDRVAFQTRTLGWFLDDVLLEFTGGNTRCAALSIKSKQAITSGGVPATVVDDAWAQFLGEGSTCFAEGHDLLALVTAPLAAEVHLSLHELVRWSVSQRDDDLEGFV